MATFLLLLQRRYIMKIKDRIIKFIVLFSFGFFAYMLIELIYRQYTFILMGVCGGIAIVLLDQINDKISWDTDILIQGACGSLIITFFEYVIGELFLNGVLPVMWDYSNVFLNYKGIICLPFSLVWVGLSIVAVVIADAINYYLLDDEEVVPYYKLFGKTIFKFKSK